MTQRSVSPLRDRLIAKLELKLETAINEVAELTEQIETQREEREEYRERKALEQIEKQEELFEMVAGGLCTATDGCVVEPDGVCEHGCESVLLAAGLI